MPHPPLSFRSFQSGAGARFFALPGNAVPDGAVQFVLIIAFPQIHERPPKSCARTIRARLTLPFFKLLF